MEPRGFEPLAPGLPSRSGTVRPTWQSADLGLLADHSASDRESPLITAPSGTHRARRTISGSRTGTGTLEVTVIVDFPGRCLHEGETVARCSARAFP